MKRNETSLTAPAPAPSAGFIMRPPAQGEPAWLGEPRGTPVGKGLAEQWLRAAAEGYKGAAETEAKAAHVVGTYLLELHAHEAWKLFPDCKGFQELAVKHAGIPVSTTYRYMQFAKVCTMEEAGWGIDKAKAGHVLVTQLGLRKFDELLDARKMKTKLGRPFDFARATAGELEQLVFALEKPALPPPADEEKEPARARRYREAVTQLLEKHPALHELHPKVRIYDGKVGVRHGPAESREQIEALIAMYRELLKL
jgi:hypothetical protein